MDGVSGIRVPGRKAKNITVVVDEPGFGTAFELSEISSGSKEILTLITQIILSDGSSNLLLIEEPELHLHPIAERKIFDLLKNISENELTKVIVTTHSEVFVDQSKVDNILHVHRDGETGVSELFRVEGSADDVLVNLGYSNSSLYQSSGILFVEGRSDQRILEEFSRTISSSDDSLKSFDELRIEVFSGGGDTLVKNAPTLANITSRLRLPFLFVFDFDDQNPDEKHQDLKGEIGEYRVHILDKYCIESYLIDSPRAISAAFNFSESKIEQYLNNNSGQKNSKNVLKGLFKEFADGVTYDEEQHGWSIARQMNASELDDEMYLIVEQINSMLS